MLTSLKEDSLKNEHIKQQLLRHSAQPIIESDRDSGTDYLSSWDFDHRNLEAASGTNVQTASSNLSCIQHGIPNSKMTSISKSFSFSPSPKLMIQPQQVRLHSGSMLSDCSSQSQQSLIGSVADSEELLDKIDLRRSRHRSSFPFAKNPNSSTITPIPRQKLDSPTSIVPTQTAVASSDHININFEQSMHSAISGINKEISVAPISSENHQDRSFSSSSSLEGLSMTECSDSPHSDLQADCPLFFCCVNCCPLSSNSNSRESISNMTVTTVADYATRLPQLWTGLIPSWILWSLSLLVCLFIDNWLYVAGTIGTLTTAVLVFILPSIIYFKLGLGRDYQAIPICGIIRNYLYMWCVLVLGVLLLLGNTIIIVLFALDILAT